MDAYSRRIIGWSIDSRQDTALVINALDMAIGNRRPAPGVIVHADHGTQFTSWVFGERLCAAGLMPSFGTVGDCLDNAMMESFWSSMQIELLKRKTCNTRVELANAIFDYIEIFHNRRRRHSALGYLSPTEFELRSTGTTPTRLKRHTHGRNQIVGQVKLSPIRAAGPTERFEDHVKDIDLVLDMVGSETVDRSWSVLSPNGAVVSVADAAIESKIPAGLRGYFVNAQPDATRLKAIAEQVAKGEFQYKIAQVFPFKELLQAIEVQRAGGNIGTLIVDFQRA
jgi:hypothetical protein